MALTTKIAWCDATANFWIGCTKISPACDHCYAEADWATRRGRVQWGPHGVRDFVKAGAGVIRRIQKGAAEFLREHGRPPIVFINSLSDFADNHASIDPAWRTAVWDSIRAAPDVVFVILTKRPQNLVRYLPADWGRGWPNVILGTTAENQDEADRRLPHLIAIPAAMRMVSAEPLLGHINLSQWLAKIDWLIVGGESGKRARAPHPNWVRSLLSQCNRTGTPFLFKQWGEWTPTINGSRCIAQDGRNMPNLEPHGRNGNGTARIERLGKDKAGRTLDGVEYHAFPSFTKAAK